MCVCVCVCVYLVTRNVALYYYGIFSNSFPLVVCKHSLSNLTVYRSIHLCVWWGKVEDCWPLIIAWCCIFLHSKDCIWKEIWQNQRKGKHLYITFIQSENKYTKYWKIPVELGIWSMPGGVILELKETEKMCAQCPLFSLILMAFIS